VQRFFIDTAPGVLAAYDDAIALGTDLSDDLEVLKGVTEHTEAYAGESASLDEFATKLAGQPGLTAAGQSALAVNAFAEATCGFSTGGN